MLLRDFVSIATPEGFTLDLELAGPGSRSAAALIDHIIIGLIVFGASYAMRETSSELGLAGFVLILSGIFFGYFIICEMAWKGQTPGKRLMHLRVVHDNGGALGWRASIVRNLVRLVDFIPFYLVGILTMFGSTQNQRLGDMAGGTLVIRQIRRKRAADVHFDRPRPEAWDITDIDEGELAVVRHFLIRREDLPATVRWDLASRLQTRLRPRIPNATGSAASPEEFLESLVGRNPQ